MERPRSRHLRTDSAHSGGLHQLDAQRVPACNAGAPLKLAVKRRVAGAKCGVWASVDSLIGHHRCQWNSA